MSHLRRYLGPIVLLIALLLTLAMVSMGHNGHGFPRWLLALTTVL